MDGQRKDKRQTEDVSDVLCDFLTSEAHGIKSLEKANFAYGSYRHYSPLSMVWKSNLPRDVEVVTNWEWPVYPQPYTWILSHEALDDDLLYSHELTLVYERWLHIKEE